MSRCCTKSPTIQVAPIRKPLGRQKKLCMAFLWKEKWFRSAPEGFWRHIQGVCWCPVRWVQHKVLRYCRARPTDWEIQPGVRTVCLWINTIYPLLQCQTSSGSVGKSIWLEFRGPRFESLLDLNVFFHHQTLRCKWKTSPHTGNQNPCLLVLLVLSTIRYNH